MKKINLIFRQNFHFSERVVSIKFIGKRAIMSNPNESEILKEKPPISNKDFEKASNKTNLNDTLPLENTNKSKLVEMRLKVNDKLYKSFLKSFQNVSSDSDIPRSKIREEDINNINFGANLDIQNWENIKYNP